ncbi:MAG: aminotransferase class I/II-fold pyridoxal phosphate-dependent enzyme, partial [Myxococcota bacterium]
MQIANRLSKVAPSATLALAQKAREMSAAGQSVISLTAGEPDFPTPIHIVDALKTSVDEGRTRYTAVTGTPELRAAIRGKYASRGFDYAVDQIIATTGAKQALYNGLMASVDEGQEV